MIATQYLAVVRKETLQTVRDKRVMALLVMAPLLQTIVFGVAVDFEVDRVPVTIADRAQTEDSRAVVRAMLADGTLVRADDAETVLVIDRSGEHAQLIIDGSDPIRAGAAVSAAAGSLVQGKPFVRIHTLYNPQLKTRFYMVPGLLGMLLVVVTTVVTAMGLAREKETGTLEQVAVTPIPPLLLLAGKMTPFLVIGLIDVLLVLVAASWIFGVPMRGSLWTLALATFFFLSCTLGIGLLISTLARTQQQSFLGGFLFVLPAALLSGIMSPISAMPTWMQWATTLNPLRWFAEIVRSVLLRGAGFSDLMAPIATLAVFGAVILGLATWRFQASVRS